MKKILALLLAMMMVFALAACGGNEETPSGGNDNPSQSQQEQNSDDGEGEDEDENVTSTLYSDDTRLVFYEKQNPKRYYVFYYEGEAVTGVEWYFPYNYSMEKENAQGVIDANLSSEDIKSQEDTGNCLIVVLDDSVCAEYDGLDDVRDVYSDLEEITKP